MISQRNLLENHLIKLVGLFPPWHENYIHKKVQLYQKKFLGVLSTLSTCIYFSTFKYTLSRSSGKDSGNEVNNEINQKIFLNIKCSPNLALTIKLRKNIKILQCSIFKNCIIKFLIPYLSHTYMVSQIKLLENYLFKHPYGIFALYSYK